MAKTISLNTAAALSSTPLPEFIYIIADFKRKIFSSLLMRELHYFLCINKYRRKFTNTADIKSILAIIDVNADDRDIIIQCSKVLRYYFPDSKIDFICNRHDGYSTSKPIVQHYDNLYYFDYGKGIATMDDYETSGNIVSKAGYSVIFNLSPFIEKEPFKNNPHFIQLYVPFYAYLDYLSSFNRLEINKSAAMHSFLHHYFSPVMLENNYPKQVKREYLLRIQNL